MSADRPVPRIALSLTLVAASLSCDAGPPPPSPRVVADELVEAEAGPQMTVLTGETTIVRARAEGADEFTWSLDGEGRISGTSGAAISFTAPEAAGRALLKVTARNVHGSSPETAVDIRVIEREPASVTLQALGAIPAGWFSGAPDPTPSIRLETAQDCPVSPACNRFVYVPGGQFGGITWWPLGCGESGTDAAWRRAKSGSCAVSIEELGGLRTVDRVTFWARGRTGSEIVEFKLGSHTLLPTPARSTGEIALTPEWAQYEIPLGGVDTTGAIALFTWVATDQRNPGGATFDLDGVVFEGLR